MATKLNKPIKRELTRTQATKNGRLVREFETGRPIIVELLPEEVLSFRVKGTKRRYTLHLMSAFLLAQTNSYITNYNEKLAMYHIKKKGGIKHLKKPKRPFLPFSNSFFQILK